MTLGASAALALALVPNILGTASADRMPMMTMTTMSSIRVNPFCIFNAFPLPQNRQTRFAFILRFSRDGDKRKGRANALPSPEMDETEEFRRRAKKTQANLS